MPRLLVIDALNLFFHGHRQEQFGNEVVEGQRYGHLQLCLQAD